ncbi:hypothetical protein [Flavobacterium sp. UBA4854]|uniref:hypothetical protein n=1 Tax=Flavobacterium sp. UBA4854 TaxID=1946548 RepID=UPI002580717E|nr:hypothetical protein [Flavobacterium sp. UBA4854]
MKKNTLILLLLNSFATLLAQAPQKMNYQSIIRKLDNSLLTNTVVGLKISILAGSAAGTACYAETQAVTTNANGLITIEIGGGTPVTGTFAGIDWSKGSYFVKTEIDPTGGNNYSITGTSQLLSVPYALYAANSQNKGKTSIILTGDITDSEAVEQIKSELGPYTENIYVNNTTNLTTLNLNEIRRVINVDISDNSKLKNISFGSLSEVLNDVSIFRNEKLTSIVFPLLKTVNGYDFSISGNPSLLSITFPSLVNIKGIFIGGNIILSSIDLPLLSSVNNSKGIGFRDNALPSSQINLILNRLLKLSSSSNYIQLGGQTPPAPPTGQGIIDKTTLIARGNNVYTD